MIPAKTMASPKSPRKTKTMASPKSTRKNKAMASPKSSRKPKGKYRKKKTLECHLGMNENNCCLRHPNQIVRNLIQINTCRICSSESKAGLRQRSTLASVIGAIQELQADKKEWAKRTNILYYGKSTPQEHKEDTDDSSSDDLPDCGEEIVIDENWKQEVRKRVLQVQAWNEKTALRFNPNCIRFFKMIELGIPLEAVKYEVELEDKDPRILYLDPGMPLKHQLEVVFQNNPTAKENLLADYQDSSAAVEDHEFDMKKITKEITHAIRRKTLKKKSSKHAIKKTSKKLSSRKKRKGKSSNKKPRDKKTKRSKSKRKLKFTKEELRAKFKQHVKHLVIMNRFFENATAKALEAQMNVDKKSCPGFKRRRAGVFEVKDFVASVEQETQTLSTSGSQRPSGPALVRNCPQLTRRADALSIAVRKRMAKKQLRWNDNDTLTRVDEIPYYPEAIKKDCFYTKEEIKFFRFEKFLEDHADEFEVVEDDESETEYEYEYEEIDEDIEYEEVEVNDQTSDEYGQFEIVEDEISEVELNDVVQMPPFIRSHSLDLVAAYF